VRYVGLVFLGMVLWAGQVTAKEPDEFDVEIRNQSGSFGNRFKGSNLEPFPE
jgi:hypothetical protein